MILVRTRRALACVLALISSGVSAQPKSDWEIEQEERYWNEVPVTLPPMPKDPDLVEFVPAASTSFRFYVDRSSLSIGKDGVIRYVLVARSSSGSSNVSYEGMRCKSTEMRIYALGRGSSWAERPNEWLKIGSKGQLWHRALYRDYLCKTGTTPLNVEEILSAMPQGGFRR